MYQNRGYFPLVIKMDDTKEKYEEAIKACIENGRRLIADSETLRDWDRFPTAKALAILAQEEFAKAYLIRLVQEGAVPWCDEIFRATRDHNCKQLMGIVMEYLYTPFESGEDLLQREIRMKENISDFLLPRKVADALNIFCHEKIERWKSSFWGWADDYKYDVEAKRIWKGQLEKNKQNALYVNIGKDGRVINSPMVDSADADKQIEYAKVLEEVSTGQDVFAFTERELIKSALKSIFDSIYNK
jgi:AbiV family abortive infection protein